MGIQVDDAEELSELTNRLREADLGVSNESESTCCYAKSKKAWTRDPSGIPWETYQTMNDAEVFSEAKVESESSCDSSTQTNKKVACC